MRAGRRSFALAALGLSPLACAVYDNQPQGAAGNGPSGDAGFSGSAGSKPNTSQGASPGVVGSASGSPSMGGNAGETTSGTGGSDIPLSGGEGGDSTGGAVNGGMPNAGSPAAGGKAGAGGHGGVSGSAGATGSAGKAGGGAAGSSGNAGTGGMAGGPLCSDHPLSLRTTWVATASDFASPSGIPANLLDNKTTRWTTGKPQAGDEWLQIDFGVTVTLNSVNLQQGSDTNDYPRMYSAIVSDTPNDLSGTVRASGSGLPGVSTPILLPALASGRYLLIKQSGSSLSWWSANEIEVSCAD
jgi:hypothetical protein